MQKYTCFVVVIPSFVIFFVDGISTDHLEIARLMGRNTKLDTLSTDDHVEIAWLIGMPKFRKLAGRLGLLDIVPNLSVIYHG